MRVFAGAVLGTSWSASLHWLKNPGLDLATALDTALAQLEAGLPL